LFYAKLSVEAYLAFIGAFFVRSRV
jgi:hypothetical protein